MQPEILAQWSLISSLLDDLLELDEGARRARLEALPAEQAALKPIIERLLAKRDQADSFFERIPVGADARSDSTGPSAEARAGAQVGPYRLLEPIGQGGMGTVWLAENIEQKQPPPVALKLPFIAGGGTQIAERFQRERQILAALNHPNIARLHEAGVTPEGQPYLALEYVEGESLLKYCEHRSLSVRQRLQLFLQVLRAVQYAHTILVIHRDLKPSNIIVTAAGEAKLLDFGIAKLIGRDTRHAEQTELTKMYGRLMTLDFASPEQVRGEALTTATDVYSLGVILFELLTGSRPYRLKRDTQAELEEAILTVECQRPSQMASVKLATAASISPARWRRALRGDLDTIVLKALEKDRAARYPTVDAFAQDCERHLQGRPVLAQAPRTLYRFAKFVGRHRVAFAATTAVVLALLAGLGTTIWQARIAVAQAKLTVEEAKKQQAVQSFMTSLFEKNTRLQANAAGMRAMTVRDLLIEAGERVQGAFDDSPPVKLELLNTIARLLREVDEYDRSAVLSREAIALAQKHGLAASDAYIEALMALSTVARVLGNGSEALQARDESLAVLDARGDQVSLLRARASINTMAQLAPSAEREIALAKQGAALYEQRYANDPGHFNAFWVLGNLYRTQQSPAEAIPYFRQAIAVFDQVGSRDYTNYGASHGFLALCEFAVGRVQQALEHYAQGLVLLDRHAGPEALVTRFHRGIHAWMLHQAGQPETAHRLFDEVRRTRPAAGPTIVDFDDAVYQATSLIEEGRAREAQSLLETFSADWVKFGKAFAVNGERWVSGLALAHAMQGRSEEARAVLGRLQELRQQTPDPDAGPSVDFVTDAAWVEMAAGKLDPASQWLRGSVDALEQPPENFDPGWMRLVTTSSALALRSGDAGRALALAEQASSHLRDKADHGGFPYLEAQALKAEGDALLASGRPDEAIAKLDAAVALMRRLHSPDSPWLLDATAALSVAASRRNDSQRARTLAAEARAIAGRNSPLAAVFLVRLTEAEQLLR